MNSPEMAGGVWLDAVMHVIKFDTYYLLNQIDLKLNYF